MDSFPLMVTLGLGGLGVLLCLQTLAQYFDQAHELRMLRAEAHRLRAEQLEKIRILREKRERRDRGESPDDEANNWEIVPEPEVAAPAADAGGEVPNLTPAASSAVPAGQAPHFVSNLQRHAA